MNAVVATARTEASAPPKSGSANALVTEKTSQAADGLLQLSLEQLIGLTEAAQRNGQLEQAINLYREWTENSRHPQI